MTKFNRRLYFPNWMVISGQVRLRLVGLMESDTFYFRFEIHFTTCKKNCLRGRSTIFSPARYEAHASKVRWIAARTTEVPVWFSFSVTTFHEELCQELILNTTENINIQELRIREFSRKKGE